MSYAIREKLIPYLGKRVKVRGVLGKWGDWMRNYRDVGRVCIQSPEIDGEVVADYVWVTDVPHWQHLRQNEGEQVEFEAVVSKYLQRSDRKTNYCLTSAGDPTLLHQPPAFRISDLPDHDDEIEPAEAEMDEPEQQPNESEVSASRDALRDLRGARAFANACGGPVKALEVLGKLPDMPLLLLKDYLSVLGEE
jgi:hypothetical protein